LSLPLQLANWLRTDSHRPKRDRRTAKVLFQLLQAQGYPGGYARVAIFAKQWREAGGASTARQAFIPLRFAPGEAFQFDWSFEYSVIGGMRRRLEGNHPPFRVVYRRESSLVRVVRVWRSERLLELPNG